MRAFNGVTIGATLGIYLFGVLVPWFNSKVKRAYHHENHFLSGIFAAKIVSKWFCIA